MRLAFVQLPHIVLLPPSFLPPSDIIQAIQVMFQPPQGQVMAMYSVGNGGRNCKTLFAKRFLHSQCTRDFWQFDGKTATNSSIVHFSSSFSVAVQEGGAAFPHVWQNGHLLLHRRLLFSLVSKSDDLCWCTSGVANFFQFDWWATTGFYNLTEVQMNWLSIVDLIEKKHIYYVKWRECNKISF